MDLETPIVLPTIWIPLISGILVPWLNALATQSVADDAPASVQRWELRLRKMFAGAASAAVAGIVMLIEAPPGSVTWAGLATATAMAYWGQRVSWSATKNFARNPNKIVRPARGLDPARVAAKAEAFVTRLSLAEAA